MRALSALSALLLTSALAACGGSSSGTTDAASSIDAPHTVDAPHAVDAPAVDAPPQTGNFACLGQPLPTTAGDPITVTGTAATLSASLSTTPTGGVAIQAFKTSGGAAIASTTSAATTGAFTLSAASGGAPLDVFVKATLSGSLDYYLYPAAPVAADVAGAPVAMLPPGNLATIDALLSVTAVPNTGTVIMNVIDCNGAPVQGATVSIKENGAEVGTRTLYVDNLVFTDTSTASKGLAVVFNVPPGTATVTAHVGTMTLRTHDIVIHADSLHAAQIAP